MQILLYLILFSSFVFLLWFLNDYTRNEKSRFKENKHDFVSALLTFALVIATAIYGLLTNKMAMEMTRANLVNLRPYVSVKGGIVGFNSNNQLVFQYPLENVGNVTAHNIRKGHKVFKLASLGKYQVIKEFHEDETFGDTLFPKEVSPEHPDVLGDIFLTEAEFKQHEGNGLRMVLKIIYNGMKDYDSSVYYTLVNYKLVPLDCSGSNGCSFQVYRTSSGEGVLQKGWFRSDNFWDKADTIKAIK